MEGDDKDDNSGQLEVPKVIYWMVAPFLWTSMLIESLRGVFRPLEKGCLDTLLQSLSLDARDSLSKQILEINHALRTTTDATEVVYYRILGTAPQRTTRSPLPIAAGESKIAKIQAQTQLGISTVAEFWAIDGRFMSIEFDKDVRKLLATPPLTAKVIWMNEALK